MRKQVLTLLAACAFMFTACEGGLNDIVKNITVDGSKLEQTVDADQTIGESRINFVTLYAWSSAIFETTDGKSVADPDWISISPGSGEEAGAYSVAITLLANTEDKARSANIVLTCNGYDLTVKLTQRAADDESGNGTNPDPEKPEYSKLIVKIVEAAELNSDYYDGYYWEGEYYTRTYRPYTHEFNYDNGDRIKEYIIKNTDGVNYKYTFSYQDGLKMLDEGGYGLAAKLGQNNKITNATRIENYNDYKEYWTDFTYDDKEYLKSANRYEEGELRYKYDFGWNNGNLMSVTNYDYSYEEQDDMFESVNYSSDVNNKTNMDLNMFFFGLAESRMLSGEYEQDEKINILSAFGFLGNRSRSYVTAKEYNWAYANFDRRPYNENNEPAHGIFRTSFSTDLVGDAVYSFDNDGYPVLLTQSVKVTKTTYVYNGQKEYLPEHAQTENEKFFIILEVSNTEEFTDTFSYGIEYRDIASK